MAAPTTQELLDAGVNPKNIPTLTAELKRQEFGGLADTEFMAEAGRFGNTDANLQLGLNWWWDTKGERTQIFDTGESLDPHWLRRGQAFGTGRLPEAVYDPDLERIVETKNTGDMWAKAAGYKDGQHWFDSMKADRKIREGLTFEKWQEDMLELGKDEAIIMYIQGKNPLQATTWSHELGHVGQYILRRIGIKSGIDPEEWKASKVTESTMEEMQRVRDIMMSSPGDPAYEEAHDWLQYDRKDDQGKPIPYTKDEIKKIAKNVLLEDQYANQVLESQGGLAKPSGDLSQYEKQHMPGFFDSMMNKLKGWFD